MRLVVAAFVTAAAMTPALVSLGALTGCRSCGDDEKAAPPERREASGPAMPSGMLVPQDNGEGGAGGAGAPDQSGEGMRVARGIKSGAWVELQVAGEGDQADRRSFDRFRDDARFVSLEAMTKLHEAFALALPGFDLFLPRLFGGEALSKLARELDALAAKGGASAAGLARELAGIVREHAQKGQSLWVLGP